MIAEACVEEFREKISKHLNIELELVINENRSTMLSILERKRDRARLSMHRMFLDAPENVISAIAHYVRGTRREQMGQKHVLRGYIQNNLARFNYSHKLDKNKLIVKGAYYNLHLIYETLNHKYFQGKLQLDITWFGSPSHRRRTRIIFGQYYDHLKLIKIHRMMDHPFFPDYFVHFVIYHEILHEVVPGYVDARGIFRSHGEEFKRRERQFVDYEKATFWERANKKKLFNSSY